jgi:membrane protein
MAADKIKRLKLPEIFINSFKEWKAKDPVRESSIIAYYSIFSFPGLFVVIVVVAGWFFGRETVDQHLIEQISSSLGKDTAGQIQNIIIQQTATKKSLFPAIIGVVTLLLGATGVFVQFQKSLNIIWNVTVDQSKTNIWSIIKVRLFSFGLILSIAFLLIISLIISTLLSAFGDWLSKQFSDSLLIFLRVISFVVSISIMTVLFALMLKIFPDAKIKWKDVWIGSFVTAVLFNFGKFALSLYFGKAHPASTYGAAGSVILILIWVSYSSMIILYGAEFTRVYSSIHSGDVRPSEVAKKKNPHEKRHS